MLKSVKELDEPTFVKVKVFYTVRGHDHDGYCSDKDGDDEEPYEVDTFKIHNLDKQLLNTDFLYTLKHTNYGCTSRNGSGYCKNMYQEYTPYKYEVLM